MKKEFYLYSQIEADGSFPIFEKENKKQREIEAQEEYENALQQEDDYQRIYGMSCDQYHGMDEFDDIFITV